MRQVGKRTEIGTNMVGKRTEMMYIFVRKRTKFNGGKIHVNP